MNYSAYGHDTPVGDTEFVIFSVDPNDYNPSDVGAGASEIISRRHAVMTFMHQNNIPFQAVWGTWEGRFEISYYVAAHDFGPIVKAGFLAGQDCVLRLGPCNARDQRRATLQYCDRSGYHSANTPDQPLGWFRSVSAEEAHSAPGYTYDPSTRTYFLAN